MEKVNSHRCVVIPTELYEQSFKSYKELFSLRIKGGSTEPYNEAMHFNGLLSFVASRIVSKTYKDKGELTYQEFQSLFDRFMPEVLLSYPLYHRLNRLRLTDYNKALSLCTENNKKLSTIIIEQLSDTAIHVINAKSELRDYADKTFRSFTYHRVVKISQAFAQIWNSSQTIVKLAFLWRHSNEYRGNIALSIIDVYKQIIHNSSDAIKNVFLYSKFEDDINHVSVVFPMKGIQPTVDVSRLMESVVVSPQLLEEYNVFADQLSNYNQSDQL